MPERSNGMSSRRIGLVPSEVRILFPAYLLNCFVNFSVPVAQPGLERCPPKAEVAGSKNIFLARQKIYTLALHFAYV